VWSSSEWISNIVYWFHPNFRSFSWGLFTGRSIEGPPFKISKRRDFFVIDFGFRSKSFTRSINPDIFSKGEIVVDLSTHWDVIEVG